MATPGAAQATRSPGAKRAGAIVLPPITVGKFQAAAELIEQMVVENRAMFIARGQEWRDEHRRASSRPLSAEEAVQVAVATIGEEDEQKVPAMAARFQKSSLRAYDEPEPLEILAAAGVATAPAFIATTQRIVALLEMPTDEFQAADEEGNLEQALDDAVKVLARLDMAEARPRASRALEHWAMAAGADPGKGLGLLADTVWQALQGAVKKLVPANPSGLSSLIDSAPSTEGSPDRTSSTASGSPTPSS